MLFDLLWYIFLGTTMIWLDTELDGKRLEVRRKQGWRLLLVWKERIGEQERKKKCIFIVNVTVLQTQVVVNVTSMHL